MSQGRSLQQGTVTWDPARAGEYGERGVPTPNTCPTVSDTLPARYAWDAGLHALNRWLLTGNAPPASPVLAVDATGHQVVRDRYGNALGGLRLPPIDIPVATYDGYQCGLYGLTTPLDPATLAGPYPTHQTYVDQMARAIEAAVGAGFMMPYDGLDLYQRACSSPVGGAAPASECVPG